jgi:hypothetical protein
VSDQPRASRACTTCNRLIGSEYWVGPYCFCSPMCRDTSVTLRDYQEHMKEFPWPQPNCGVPDCHVCSGAMRERKGGGDQ